MWGRAPPVRRPLTARGQWHDPCRDRDVMVSESRPWHTSCRDPCKYLIHGRYDIHVRHGACYGHLLDIYGKVYARLSICTLVWGMVPMGWRPHDKCLYSLCMTTMS